MTKTEAIHALRTIADAIIEAVREAGAEGVSASVLYMALAEHGCSFAQFEQIMSALVQAGKLRTEGYRYFVVP